MAKKRKRPRGRKLKSEFPPDSPVLVFINAMSWQTVVRTLNVQTHHKEILKWPTMVAEALCLELFIKAVHRMRRRKIIKSHGIRADYGRIGRSDRKTIEKYLAESMALHPSYEAAVARGAKLDADSILMRAENMFVHGRYWHELIMPGEDTDKQIGNPGLSNLNDGLRNLILDVHPEWLNAVEHFKFHALQSILPPTSPAR